MFTRNVVKKSNQIKTGLTHVNKRFASAAAKVELDVAEVEENSMKLPFYDARLSQNSSVEILQKEAQITSTPIKTQLKNGLNVISTDSYIKGNAVLSLYVDAGSRFENARNNGVSHFVQRFFFGPTNQRSYVRFATELQKTGANVTAQNGREEIVYRSESLREAVPQVWSLMSNSITQARLHEWDMAPKKEAVKLDLSQYADSPEQVLSEALHQTAFGGKGLGRSLVCPPHNVNAITVDTVAEFMNTYFRPERMTLVGTNVNHEDLQYLSEHLFTNMEVEEKKFVSETSKYVGGNAQLGENRASPIKTHTVLAFESVNQTDKNYYALQVLANYLGEATQANIYKPTVTGKNSLLYTQVLTKVDALYDARAFSISYSDSGLFGVYLTSRDSTKIGSGLNLVLAALKQIVGSSQSLSNIEGAKRRTLLNLASNLETSVGLNEFVAKTKGQVTPQQAYAAIMSVSAEQVRQAAESLLKSKPTLVSYGDLEGVPTTFDLQLH